MTDVSDLACADIHYTSSYVRWLLRQSCRKPADCSSLSSRSLLLSMNVQQQHGWAGALPRGPPQTNEASLNHVHRLLRKVWRLCIFSCMPKVEFKCIYCVRRSGEGGGYVSLARAVCGTQWLGFTGQTPWKTNQRSIIEHCSSINPGPPMYVNDIKCRRWKKPA